MVGLRPAISCAVCLALCGGTVDALDVAPGNPVPPFTLVRIKLDPGERAWVLGQDLMPVDLEPTAGGGLVFTAKPGRYAVLAFSETGQSQKIVEISGTAPGPGPGPGPGPEPPPPGPANFGFEKFVIENSGVIAASGRRHIRAVAANFASAAAAIRSGKVLTLESATSHIARLNATTLGTDVVSWNVWLTKIGYAVDHLEDDCTIGNVTQKAQVFDEIASGLKKYADQESITRVVPRSTIRVLRADVGNCISDECLQVAP